MNNFFFSRACTRRVAGLSCLLARDEQNMKYVNIARDINYFIRDGGKLLEKKIRENGRREIFASFGPGKFHFDLLFVVRFFRDV